MDKYGGYGNSSSALEPSPQIMVHDVGAARVPFAIALTGWTMLAFLVDGKRGSCRAIKTAGQGKLAEILFDGTRSKGCGVLQFTQVPLASVGRPLDVRFDDRWRTFSLSAAKGGQVMPLQADG
ncbi:hypothetical protein BKA83DRAFT_4225234 [Pisolithus microcarpus]|nr:hypothetical protein BKA83DRAFT_4225234 [Pisolithus microcarpus]